MKFKFISICTYVCGVCPMYCWFSNSLVPMSLGTILFVLLFQEQLEMHWMLGSPIRKMLRPCDYWSQVRMIKEQLSTTSIQCCLGNKYPLHAFFSCKGPNLSFLFQVASWHESLDSFLQYLFAFSKHPNDDVLLLVGMSLMFVCWKFILYNKKILGHVLCFQAKDLIDIFMTSFFGYLVFFLLVTISCVHTSLWIYIYHHDCLLLRIFYT